MLAEDPGRAFEGFYRAVHGRTVDPFPWQVELAEEVCRLGTWPEIIDLPTGSGKTSVIDVAVFALAHDAQRSAPALRLPRRIVLIVDRRVVVDQAAARGRAIARALMSPSDDLEPELRIPIDEVGDALRGLSGNGPPLIASVLRGGIAQDTSWALRPDVPAVMASTVDQAGSRLLFRGYGVSKGMRPVHAGLLANDALLILDEVHLSQPFAQTLAAIERYQTWREFDVPAPRWQVVAMSATPGPRHPAARTFPAHPLEPSSHPVLERRMTASKPAVLRPVKVSSTDPVRARQQLASACVSAVDDAFGAEHVRTLLVVVNRVSSARAAYSALVARGHDAILMTGRMRALDRDRIVSELEERLRTGRHRDADAGRLVVVATQCIEAGADFDFDAIVTECASLDSLRQRFGRVDRDGALSEQGAPAPGIILGPSTTVSDSADPVYGPALSNTWRWLSDQASLDFGILAMHLPEDPVVLAPLLAPKLEAPHLLPGHLDIWAQTSTKVSADPEVSTWLHGLRPARRDVNVVWRADLTEALLSDQGQGPGTGHAPAALALVAACPPSSAEAMSVPINAVRSWLAGAGQEEEMADVDGAAFAAPEPGRSRRPVLVWRGDRSYVAERRTGSFGPDDTIVVPASYGGVAQGSWEPSATEPVADLGHAAQLLQRRRAVLRLVPGLFPDHLDLPAPAGSDEDVDEREVVLDWLQASLVDFDGLHAKIAQHLLQRREKVRVRRLKGPVFQLTERTDDGGQTGRKTWQSSPGSADWFVVTSRLPVPTSDSEDATPSSAVDAEEEVSSFTAVEVPLEDHLAGVEQWARRLASNCRLPDNLVEDLALAGRLHDLGKADPRFQAMLHGGDEIAAAAASTLLAKSEIPSTDRNARWAAQRRSRYPWGTRHELLSLALIESHLEVSSAASDWDLVCHLVASHHGWCRPFAPPVEDLEPQRVKLGLDGRTFEGWSDHGLDQLDSGVADRFWRVLRCYGWFQLAWLEALLRLADHRQSESEQATEGNLEEARRTQDGER